MAELIKQSNYRLDLEGKQYPFLVEELVSNGAGWPQKFRARFHEKRAGEGTGDYGKSEKEAAESFAKRIKESYRAT